ncbi:3,4-dihydroxy-2-butanone 4-phosphate synthase [uncultured archaeon]|nr:3,4-dihydroxy-2-butanone 4-phosphate synthase [uncultured archaeon]
MNTDELTPLLEVMRQGVPVVLLDDPKREGEADLIFHAKYMTPENVRLMRKEAGGLICLATDEEQARKIGVPFMADLLRESRHPTLKRMALERSPYGDPSAFSIWINSRSTFTGITDEDRSATIRKFEELVRADGKEMAERFSKEFYSPGHVPLLISRGINHRKGHTELTLALAKKAGISPVMCLCEMLGDNGRAMPWNQVRSLAQQKGWLIIEGPELIKALEKKN